MNSKLGLESGFLVVVIFVWLAPITTNYQLVWALSARIVVAHLWSNVRRSATPPAQLPLFALMSEDGG